MRMLPVIFRWLMVETVDAETGEVARRRAMVPLARYDNVAGRQFSDGEEYPLVVLEARTRASHNHYFAAIHEAFENIPEEFAARWLTPEHMRKWVLCETGWCEEKEFDCPDEKFARRLGMFIRGEDAYARISFHRIENGTFKLIVRRAKSQSAASMPKQEFEDSKRDVLDYLASIVGVKASEFKKQAGRSG